MLRICKMSINDLIKYACLKKIYSGGWGCSSVVEHLLSSYKALGWISPTEKKKKGRKRRRKKERKGRKEGRKEEREEGRMEGRKQKEIDC
jgi:hypothetical protein